MRTIFRTHFKIKGFTLVETLVAILALSLSLGALTLIASKSVISARDAELRLQAELLAMEGIETAQFAVLNKVLDNKTDTTSSQVALALANTATGGVDCTKGCGVVYNGLVPELKTTPQSGDYFDKTIAFVGNTATSPDVQFGNNYNISTPLFQRLIVVKPASSGSKGYMVRSIVYYGPVSALVPKRVVLTKEIQPWYLAPVAAPSSQ